MKRQRKMTVIHVVSEPGDATRYSYMFYRDGPDKFCFAPVENTFNYPQRINYWYVKDVKDVTDLVVTEIAQEYSCNPYTVMECIRTVQEIYNQ